MKTRQSEPDHHNTQKPDQSQTKLREENINKNKKENNQNTQSIRTIP